MRMPNHLRWTQLWLLCWRDLVWERTLSACAIFVVAAALAPLWILWGLNNGVLGGLIDRMEKDPQLRRITPAATGINRFDQAWLERIRAWPEVAFVVPTVRFAASLVDLQSISGAAALNVELFETAPGDPFLINSPAPREGEIILSQGAANRLKIQPGQTVQLAFGRIRDGVSERAVLELRVPAVLAAEGFSREGGFVTTAVLTDIEHWRDGYTVASIGSTGAGEPPIRTLHPRFRLHTHSIRQIKGVADRLEAEGVALDVDYAPIASTLGLQSNLQSILILVGTVTGTGAALALAALQAASVRRKRKEYALLKLTGHGRSWLIAIPCLNAGLIAFGGVIVALLLYLAAALTINSYFSAHFLPGEAAVRLGAAGALWGAVGAMTLSIAPGAWAGWRAITVDAADELREV
jgi:putative ABC transport system permease protein